ncbi:MAG: C25 family cysteine peptidase [Caldilineaceae bacterium]
MAKTLRLQLINDAPGQAVDMAYIDWVKLTYYRQLGGQDNYIDFTNRGPGNWKYNIGGFDQQEVEAYDVTDPNKVRLVLGAVENGAFNFSDYQATPRRYIVSAVANRLTAQSIEPASSTDLRTISSSIDYIMVAHPDLVDAIRPLAEYRSRRGLNVLVVNLQDIYDQFNYGRASAQAIQDFLKYAYTNWPAPAPRFALLVGDGNYDPLGYRNSSEPSLLPPYLAMVDPDLGETAADNRYAAIVGEDLIPDLSIGRFPAKTPADVAAMLEKTMRYEQAPPDPNWNQSILFVADDLEGGGGAFQNFSDAIADGYIETEAGRLPLLPADYTRTKLYLGAGCEDGTPAIQCRQEIVNEVNKGLLFVSYVGHGAKQYWAEEQLFNQDALFQLNNAARLPIMLPMTCLEGFFHEAEANSDAFGEMIVRMAQSGAVASWSPTGFGLASGHDYLETGFFLGLFHQGLTTVGEATVFGKMHMIAHAPPTKYDDLLDTFVLFGDPALAVRSAGREPVVDIQSLYLPISMRD